MPASRKTVWTVMGLVVVASVMYLNQEPETGSTSTRTAKSASQKTDDGFTKDDYEATFERVSVQARNPFIPLVVGSRSKGPIGIPPSLAGGDPNWIFTGMAEIDTVPVALLENRETMDGVFLKHGEMWNGSRVVAISPEELVLAGSDGIRRKVYATFEDEQTRTATSTTGPEVRPMPVDPNMRGPIGGGLSVQPEGRDRRRRTQSGVSEPMAAGNGQGVTNANPNIQ